MVKYSSVLFCLFSSYTLFAQIEKESDDTDLHFTDSLSTETETYEIVCPIEIVPRFPGGYDSLRAFIDNNLRRRPGNIHLVGPVYVQFRVDSTGSIDSAKVLRGLSEFENQEAVRLIMSLPKFIPGEVQGKKADFQLIYPVRFDY